MLDQLTKECSCFPNENTASINIINPLIPTSDQDRISPYNITSDE